MNARRIQSAASTTLAFSTQCPALNTVLGSQHRKWQTRLVAAIVEPVPARPELPRVHPELVHHITYYNVAVLQFSYSYPAEECLNFIGISPLVAYNEQSSTEFLPSYKKMRIEMLGTDLDKTETIKI